MLGVVVLDDVRLFRALAERLRLRRRAGGEEAHLALQLEQLLVGVGLHFEALELLHERVAERSSFTSAAASSLRSSCSICSAIRSKVSNALLSEIEDIVSWMRLCASARFWRATRIFFLRFASSILSLSWRSEPLSFSVSSRCLIHVSCSWTAFCTCSL